MDVAVHYKPRHRGLRSHKPSVLGGGLLERARSTTLALLGVTTAVGLAMVALALNQSWPVIADSPIPLAPPRHEAVGKASVAAEALARVPDSSPASTGASGPDSSRPDRGSSAPAEGSTPTASAELVVAPSAPAEAGGDGPRDTEEPAPSSPPAGETPQAPAAPVPVTEARAQPEPAPPSPPAAEAPPPPTSAGVPVDSSDDEEWDDDNDWDDDGDWDDDHDRGRGHHWGRGRHGD